MKTSIALIAAAAAPFAAALKHSSSGGAKVINYCNKDFPYDYIPAKKDGADNPKSSSGVLKANGGDFFSPWIQLDKIVQGGWALKINANDDWDNIYQYEYTWEDPDIIWLDMSFVNGREETLPKWKFECPGLDLHNNAYQNATDDANGMQKPAKPEDVVTLLLCPENASGGYIGGSPSVSASLPAYTTETPTPSTTLQTYPVKSSATPSAYDLGLKQANVAPVAESSSTPAPLAASPVVDPESDLYVVYETQFVTAVVTAYATETAHAKHRRHAHRHPHGHSF